MGVEKREDIEGKGNSRGACASEMKRQAAHTESILKTPFCKKTFKDLITLHFSPQNYVGDY